MTIRLKKKHHLMMLQTLKFHKHTTWSVYASFLFCQFALFATTSFQGSPILTPPWASNRGGGKTRDHGNKLLFTICIFQTSEIDLRGPHCITLHCLLCNKSIEMNLLSSKTQPRFSVFGTCFDVSNIIISHYEYTVKIYKIVGI